MASTLIQHPVFGKALRTEESGLVIFRQYPHLRMFGNTSPRAIDGKLFISHLNKRERHAVDNWKNPTKYLESISNKGAVFSALHYRGIFETTVELPDGKSPSQSQESAYKYFQAHEEKICANVLDALLRYYRFAKKIWPDSFDEDLLDQKTPEYPTPKQFSKLIEFWGMEICRCSASGLSPLLLRWEPIWDYEHKLQTLVFRDQVVMIDPDITELITENPGKFIDMHDICWGRKQMTRHEKAALEEFIAGFTLDNS